ncbi:MAG: MBL fold metallo-hydrolase [Pseudomonadota bacterium]
MASEPHPPLAEVLVTGSSVRLERDFIGISTVVLLTMGTRRVLVDAGGPATRGTLLAGLRARGLQPGAIDTVVLTHLHFDHVANIDLFPRAELIVSRAEIAYAAAPHPDDAFVPDGILQRLGRRRVRVLEDQAEPLDAQAVCGVTIIPAPGHTPGQLALRVEGMLEDGGGRHAGRIVLAADAIKTPRELATGRADLEFDRLGRAAETMAALAEGADAIVPGHAPTLTKGPGGWASAHPVSFPLVIR